MTIVVTGVAGVHAKMVASVLSQAGHRVIGIDHRPCPDAPPGVEVHQLDVRKRPAVDLIRVHRPRAVVHLGTVSHFEARREERFRINLHGTRTIIEACAEHGVGHFVFVSRHTVYGAAPDAPLYRTEIEPPLGAATFPDLADLVAADLYAGSIGWRFPEIATCVLRAVYVLGPSGRGTLAEFLRHRRVPMVLGFDPLFQFMHEHDMARAVAMAVEQQIRGVYNVTGPPPLPLSWLAEAVGRTAVAMPERLIPHVLGRLGFPRLPRGAIEHLKHPVVVSGAAFAAKADFVCRYDETATIDAFLATCPPPK